MASNSTLCANNVSTNSLTVSSGVGFKRPVVALTDAAAAGAIRSALTVAESGTLFLVPNLSGGTQTLTLPEPTSSAVGTTYTFLVVGATAGQIFQLLTNATATKIITAEPDGDGTVTVNASADEFHFTAIAAVGAAFTITCISTTVANAWHVSGIVSGLAAATGEHIAA